MAMPFVNGVSNVLALAVSFITAYHWEKKTYTSGVVGGSLEVDRVLCSRKGFGPASTCMTEFAQPTTANYIVGRRTAVSPTYDEGRILYVCHVWLVSKIATI
ncbi:hypothetical protein GGR51DRAFT_523921 [Nemania sp. FL0031]|nr:hypothetical protein GGR51DRAFT_523921 [Nemania sp. FL0031]